MSEDRARNPESLERARRLAQEALADDGRAAVPEAADKVRDELVQKTRDEAGKVLAQFPEGSPARVTRAFAHVLDNLVRIPGTNFRFGVDPLLSFVPAAGTAVGAAFGAVVLVDAVRLRAPVPVLARMLGNYLIDWLLGIIPFVGGFLDAAYRSNSKNLKLLNRTIADREQVRRSSVTYWLSVAVMAAVVLAVMVGIPVALLLWLDQLVRSGG